MSELKYRYNKTRQISVDPHENPKIMARLLVNGNESVFLECYIGKGKRTSKTLKGLFLYTNPTDAKQRKHNAEVIKMARAARDKEEIEYIEKSESYTLYFARDKMSLFWHLVRVV